MSIRNCRSDVCSSDLPLCASLTFSFRAAPTTRLSGRETIEIATVDGRLSARIAPGAGYAVQNDTVGVVKADLATALGASAYGPIRFRILQDDVAGAWAPLATLVDRKSTRLNSSH